MAGPIYPSRDRRYDHLYFQPGTDEKAIELIAAAKAQEKILTGISAALFFLEGQETYRRKLNRLIESFTDDAA